MSVIFWEPENANLPVQSAGLHNGIFEADFGEWDGQRTVVGYDVSVVI
jgi:hypothetical protein